MPDHSKWTNKQIQAAIAIGVNPLDAQAAAKAFLALLPDGADPDTYIVPAAQLEQDISAPELTQDAVAAWVAREDVPTRYKLILVSGEEP